MHLTFYFGQFVIWIGKHICKEVNIYVFLILSRLRGGSSYKPSILHFKYGRPINVAVKPGLLIQHVFFDLHT